ncbi:hypothetical protein ZTR_00695 [Talaromyces verruculosus]|nr:hypothetical protein ZTR_00695 [Talaromyces verruculosus]
MLPVIAAVLVGALLSYYLIFRKDSGSPLPPGPKRLPIVGNVLDLPPKGLDNHLVQTLTIIQDSKIAHDLLENNSKKTSGRPYLLFANAPNDVFEHIKIEASAIILKLTCGYTIEKDIEDPLVSLIEHMMDNFTKAFIPMKWSRRHLAVPAIPPRSIPGHVMESHSPEMARNQPYGHQYTKKAQAEIDAVVGGYRFPTFDDHDKLPYVSALVEELLRCSPVVPVCVTHVTTDEAIYEGYRIPKGSYVLPSTWWFAHDPKTNSDRPDIRS